MLYKRPSYLKWAWFSCNFGRYAFMCFKFHQKKYSLIDPKHIFSIWFKTYENICRIFFCVLKMIAILLGYPGRNVIWRHPFSIFLKHILKMKIFFRPTSSHRAWFLDERLLNYAFIQSPESSSYIMQNHSKVTWSVPCNALPPTDTFETVLSEIFKKITIFSS